MPLHIVEKMITLAELSILAKEWFGDMVKVVVDVEQEKMAIGCELHVDAEELLLKQGSVRQTVLKI